MLTATLSLLKSAQAQGYAIGAFNVYNLEGVRAVIVAAETAHSPVMLQLHPAAIHHGGRPLIALCLAAAEDATIPVSVHLDHSAAADDIRLALSLGVNSIMADGSHLSYAENLETYVSKFHNAEAGLIYKNRYGKYSFAVPLLADFIRRQT